MTGVTYTLDFKGDAATAALGRLSEMELGLVMDAISTLLEGQTENRMIDEKTSPDGAPWAPWSKRYARTRGNTNSLLIGREDLFSSIEAYHDATTARVGTPAPYAAIHQFGGRGIPARPYLGVSKQNMADIREVVIDHVLAVLE